MGATSAEPITRAIDWVHKLGDYRKSSTARALLELALTALPFAAIWYAMYWAVTGQHFFLYVLLVPVAVGFLVRLFLIQHDCGHHAFLPNRFANDWLGRAIGVLTLTPYEHWRRAHAIHHATAGNLDRRGVGDIDTLTVAEYRARTPGTRLRYRLYRNPFIMLGIGPAFVFVLQNRVPAGFFRGGWQHWGSTMGTNIGIAALFTTLITLVGLRTFLLVHAPIMLVSATVGGWLFYVQHQFENTYWNAKERWSSRDAALHGSSHYDLPPVLRWMTANIGVHHVHHLCSRIPFYRLPDVLRDHPDLRAVGRVRLLESFRCIRLTLWDEEARRMVTFREVA
jgi:omega-6 fatty acid desaturase (delta-12 desaturase)